MSSSIDRILRLSVVESIIGRAALIRGWVYGLRFQLMAMRNEHIMQSKKESEKKHHIDEVRMSEF